MMHHDLVPPLPRPWASPAAIIPTDQQCMDWWRSHDMMEHIERHSQLVADIATDIARLAMRTHPELACNLPPERWIQTVRASGLLHDLGKTYTIRHGGNHSLLGGAWAMTLTANPHIAQGVIHHVHWPGALDPQRVFLPLAIIYSDKRVMHDAVVSLDQRFADLLERYGRTERSRTAIAHTFAQGKEIETTLSTFLGEDLHAYCAYCRRMVG